MIWLVIRTVRSAWESLRLIIEAHTREEDANKAAAKMNEEFQGNYKLAAARLLGVLISHTVEGVRHVS